MKKKVLLSIIILAVIVILVVINNLVPLWVSILTILTFFLGGAVGFIVKPYWDKLVEKDEELNDMDPR